MSSRHRVYVGPYIICKNSEVPAMEKVNGCSKKGCGSYGRQSDCTFCPDCGTKVQLFEVPSTARKVGFETADRLLGVKLHIVGNAEDDGVDVWVSNYALDARVKRRNDEYFTGTSSIHDDDPAEEKGAFATEFRREINQLKKLYGEEAVELCWGVIGWWT